MNQQNSTTKRPFAFEIPVNDLESAVSFYNEVFGVTPRHANLFGDQVAVILDEKSQLYGLLILTNKSLAHRSIVVEVRSVLQFNTYCENVRRMGVLLEGNLEVEGEAVQVNFEDRDGNQISLLLAN